MTRKVFHFGSLVTHYSFKSVRDLFRGESLFSNLDNDPKGKSDGAMVLFDQTVQGQTTSRQLSSKA